jgi:hypothetical protein
LQIEERWRLKKSIDKLISSCHKLAEGQLRAHQTPQSLSTLASVEATLSAKMHSMEMELEHVQNLLSRLDTMQSQDELIRPLYLELYHQLQNETVLLHSALEQVRKNLSDMTEQKPKRLKRPHVVEMGDPDPSTTAHLLPADVVGPEHGAHVVGEHAVPPTHLMIPVQMAVSAAAAAAAVAAAVQHGAFGGLEEPMPHTVEELQAEVRRLRARLSLYGMSLLFVILLCCNLVSSVAAR